MTVAHLGSLDLAFETFGDQSAEPLLLVMGLGGPMIWWEDAFCEQLASVGFFVIRFDNRDAGLSTKFEGRVTFPMVAKAFVGGRVAAPYSIGDMAADAWALLDHLGIDSAHVVGMSMGGMIAQTMAITEPTRTRSLTSIMSTTGARTVGWQDPLILPAILRSAPGEEGYVATMTNFWRLVGSPSYRLTPEAIEAQARGSWAYGVSGPGTSRQMLAVLTQPNRTEALRALRMPSLVIHGLADRMVHVSGGRATSMAIPGSDLLLLKGMGHDLPVQLWPTYIRAIRRTASRAKVSP